MTCPSCGATAPATATWCGQCHQPLVAPASAPAVPGRFIPAAPGPAVVPVYSRWRGGPTSLGPVGRIGWTAAVLLIAAFAAFSGDVFFIGIWCLLVGPLVLRSVWSRARIR